MSLTCSVIALKNLAVYDMWGILSSVLFVFLFSLSFLTLHIYILGIIIAITITIIIINIINNTIIIIKLLSLMMAFMSKTFRF